MLNIKKYIFESSGFASSLMLYLGFINRYTDTYTEEIKKSGFNAILVGK